MPLELMKSSIGCLLMPNKLLTTTPNIMLMGVDLLNLRLDIRGRSLWQDSSEVIPYSWRDKQEWL